MYWLHKLIETMEITLFLYIFLVMETVFVGLDSIPQS